MGCPPAQSASSLPKLIPSWRRSTSRRSWMRTVRRRSSSCSGRRRSTSPSRSRSGGCTCPRSSKGSKRRHLFACPLAMRVGVRAGPEAREVLEDFVLAADRLAVVENEHRDLVGADVLPHLVALIGVRRDLPRPEVEAQLGESLADFVGVWAPFRLVELHESGFPPRRFTQTR